MSDQGGSRAVAASTFAAMIGPAAAQVRADRGPNALNGESLPGPTGAEYEVTDGDGAKAI